MKFDICLMNPPYSDNQPGDGFYAKFLNKAIELTDTLISINPDPAVTGHQSGSIAKKEFSKFRNIMDTYYVEVDSINNDTFPDAHIKSGLCIVYLDKNKNHEIVYTKDGVTTTFQKQADINNYFDNPYLVEFDNKIRKYFAAGKDCVENHMKLTKGYGDFSKIKLKEPNPDPSLLYIYLIKPNAAFTYAAYNTRGGVREYSDDDQKRGAGYITFKKSERKEAENALKYIQSDFVHLCVIFSSISNIGSVNRYSVIPWIDFSRSYTEQELFKLIGMKYNKTEVDKIIND